MLVLQKGSTFGLINLIAMTAGSVHEMLYSA